MTLGRDIDRKLCLTAAFLGIPTRKQLASAFHAINPATSFDIERAHKWLQGRAKPRDPRLYEDWASLLDIARDGSWIADIDAGEFLDALVERAGIDRATLVERAELFGGRSVRVQVPVPDTPSLVGSYACYSHAWSPYFRGRLIRGVLTIQQEAGRGLVGTYTEMLPNGETTAEGPVLRMERTLHLDLRRAADGIQLLFCLFPPSAPATVLGGLMCGAPILGPLSPPSVTRIVMLRLPGPARVVDDRSAYLPPGGSVAADLVELGLLVNEPKPADQAIRSFLSPSEATGFDQVPVTAYHDLVAIFDAQWLADRADPPVASADDDEHGVVRLHRRR